MRDIGKNIRDLRLRAGLNQDQLAERLYVTRQTISNYENGRTRPDVDQILRIAEIFGTDANTVLYGPPVPEGRRSAYIRTVVGAGLTTALGAVYYWAVPIVKNWQRTNYDPRPVVGLAVILRPLLLLLLGWTLVQILSLAVPIKTPQKPWVRRVRWVLPAVTLCGLLSGVTYVLLYYVELFNALPDFLWSFLYKVLLATMDHPYAYSFLGVALRLLGFPAGRPAAEKAAHLPISEQTPPQA